MAYTETHRDEIRSYHARYRKEHPDNCARATARWLEDAYELTANGARHGMPWDYTDDVFVMTSTKSLIEIAYELGRTYSACACRRKNLRKAGWTP